MFSLKNNLHFRKITVSSVVTCIYIPILTAIIYLTGWLYSLGKRSSWFYLVIIFVIEFFKLIYLKEHQRFLPEKRCKPNSILLNAIKCIAFIISTIFIYFVILILFGAPVFDNHEETTMLSILLTLLTSFPLVCWFGMERTLQMLSEPRDYDKGTIVEMLVNNAIMSICGAWLGAIVIPLDWNVPWQVWPIPCYIGVLMGYFMVNLFTASRSFVVLASNKYPMLNYVVKYVYRFR